MLYIQQLEEWYRWILSCFILRHTRHYSKLSSYWLIQMSRNQFEFKLSIFILDKFKIFKFISNLNLDFSWSINHVSNLESDLYRATQTGNLQMWWIIPYSTLSSPQNDRHFAKLGGGLDKGDFYFKQIYIQKNLKKTLSQSYFLICY